MDVPLNLWIDILVPPLMVILVIVAVWRVWKHFEANIISPLFEGINNELKKSLAHAREKEQERREMAMYDNVASVGKQDETEPEELAGNAPMTTETNEMSNAEPNPNAEETMSGKIKRFLELEKETEDIRIETKALGRQTVEIRWRFKKPYAVSKITLYGFRNEGSIMLHEEIPPASMMHVIQDSLDGRIIEYLEAGKAYHYTLILIAFRRVRTLDNPIELLGLILGAPESSKLFGRLSEQPVEVIRFTLRAPRDEEIESDIVDAKSDVKSDPWTEELEGELKGLKTKLERRTKIQDFKAREFEIIKNRKYPPEREREELESLDRVCEEALMECE